MSQRPTRPPSSARRRAPGASGAASDAALAARLERLSQRRAGTDGGNAGSTTSSRSGRTRRHPARQARAAAIGLTLGATAALTSFFNIGTGGVQQVAAANIVSGAPNPTTPTTGAPAGPVGPVAPSTTAAATGQPVVVDGAVYHNRWGDVQVEATFGPDGSLVNVDAIKSPNHRGTSIQINDYAVPRLDQEAVSIQGAQIHVISGATYTSVDYARSLQSAIDAARSANVTQLS